MGIPSVRHRRGGLPPLLRRERIGGGQQRQLRAHRGCILHGRHAHTGSIAAHHLLVVDGAGGQPGVRPGGFGGAAVGYHLRPHARIHVGTPRTSRRLARPVPQTITLNNATSGRFYGQLTGHEGLDYLTAARMDASNWDWQIKSWQLQQAANNRSQS